ncbi:hypothetical protein GCM10011579_048440 [Streptomyces albiflavescens]|uniref:Uncharacterized protein n=1 Tax=Streptomyces albiflavescens TaxID=1623582 RepID=A0A918D6U0_9ACTN|nr:hypothetical protein GCM10011579_048440 [Streptomyces albiflavescens]
MRRRSPGRGFSGETRRSAAGVFALYGRPVWVRLPVSGVAAMVEGQGGAGRRIAGCHVIDCYVAIIGMVAVVTIGGCGCTS